MRYSMLAALVALPVSMCMHASFYETLRSMHGMPSRDMAADNIHACDWIKSEMRDVIRLQSITKDPHEYWALEERFVDLMLTEDVLQKRLALAPSESFSQGWAKK